MASEKYLAIYLQDHLAGSVAGRELARRAENSNKDNELGRFLSRLGNEIDEDIVTLREVMAALDVSGDRLKNSAAWIGEKLGRLKLNGELTSYSPLSRLVELEALSLGVEGKLCLWQAFQETLAADPRLARFDFAALAERAARQRAELEEQRLRAAEAAFAPARHTAVATTKA